MKTLTTTLGLCLILLPLCSASQGERPLVVGVTIQPYYSWVVNIVGDAPVEVVPVLRPEADFHTYQPSPEELKRLAGLDALVLNGLGHDDFVMGMLQASGNKHVTLINPNQGLPLIPYDRGKSHVHGEQKPEAAAAKPAAYNPHTFLSLTGAVQQVYTLARELSALFPEHSKVFRDNARAYARRLRMMKAEAAEKLAGTKIRSVATVHDGYSYLLQEFSVEVAAVIEPAHGIQPSAKELAETIEAIKATGTRVVFSELTFPQEYVDLIQKETGVRVYTLDHMGSGAYTADRFETSMRSNLDTLIKALVTDVQTP